MKIPSIQISFKVKGDKIIGAWRYVSGTCTYGSMYENKDVKFITDDCIEKSKQWGIDLNDVVWANPLLEDLYASNTHCWDCQKNLFSNERYTGEYFIKECNNCGHTERTIRDVPHFMK